MKFRFAWIAIAIGMFIGSAQAAAPKDFRVVYFSSAGALEKATVETITVKPGSAVMDRDAVQVGGSGEKVKESKTYQVSPEQFDELYQLVQQSGYLTWPAVGTPPHQSQIEEYFEITVDGKTVKRSRWEEANLEKFRQFYSDFNRWYTTIRSVAF